MDQCTFLNSEYKVRIVSEFKSHEHRGTFDIYKLVFLKLLDRGYLFNLLNRRILVKMVVISTTLILVSQLV